MKDDVIENENILSTIIIENVLRALSLSAPNFARQIGVNYQRVFDLMRGRVKKLSPSMVNKICETFPNINKSYLYTGDGEVLITPSEMQSQNEGLPNQENRDNFMGMYSKMISLFEQIQSRDRELFDKSVELMQKESQLNEREQRLIEREGKLDKKELELSRKYNSHD